MTKAFKLRLVPTKEQKQCFEQWAGCARFTYNKTLGCLKNPKDRCRNWMSLRNRFVTARAGNAKAGAPKVSKEEQKKKRRVNTFIAKHSFLEKTPKHIRLAAVKEACSALKACRSNLKAGNISHFDMGYKSKKQELKKGWSLALEAKDVTRAGDVLKIFPGSLAGQGIIKYRSKKQLHKLMPGKGAVHECRVQKNCFGEYYLVLVTETACKPQKTEHHSVVSYDPGVKKYLVGYDPCGKAFVLGENVESKLMPLIEKLDRLYSERSSARGRRVHAVNAKCIRLRKRIHNLKQELHNQANNFVTTRSSLVVYPKLDTGRLVMKERRTLTTKAARSLLSLGHCTAYAKLVNKCLERGVTLMTPSEAYTTKTCGCCGTQSECTKDRMFTCSGCGYRAERDLNGAQNILLCTVA